MKSPLTLSFLSVLFCLNSVFAFDIYDGGTEVYQDRVEFVCPLDDTVTVYEKSKHPNEYTYLSAVKDYDYALEQLNEFGSDYARFSYDQTFFCKKHNPKQQEKFFFLTVKYKNGTMIKNKLAYDHTLAVKNNAGNPVKDKKEYVSRLLTILVLYLDSNNASNRQTGSIHALSSNNPVVQKFLGVGQ